MHPFVRSSAKLVKAVMYHRKACDISVYDISAINAERRKLLGASKLTIYLLNFFNEISLINLTGNDFVDLVTAKLVSNRHLSYPFVPECTAIRS